MHSSIAGSIAAPRSASSASIEARADGRTRRGGWTLVSRAAPAAPRQIRPISHSTVGTTTTAIRMIVAQGVLPLHRAVSWAQPPPPPAAKRSIQLMRFLYPGPCVPSPTALQVSIKARVLAFSLEP